MHVFTILIYVENKLLLCIHRNACKIVKIPCTTHPSTKHVYTISYIFDIDEFKPVFAFEIVNDSK